MKFAHTTSSRSGMSLIIVLSVMVLTTVVGTALYRTLSKQNATSGAQLHSQTALAAAKAGLAATRSWFQYNGDDAKSILDEVRNRKDSLGYSIPREIDVAGSYMVSDSAQSFRAFLVDIQDGPPMTVKFQVVGYGRDGSEVKLTAVYGLEGIVPFTSSASGSSSSYVGSSSSGAALSDALFAGGGITQLNANANITGSLYVGTKGLQTNGYTLTVSGDLVLGSGEGNGYFNAPVTVGGDFYSASPFYTNDAVINIAGNAYFQNVIKYLTADMTIGGDAVFADVVGSETGVKYKLWIKGNARFHKRVNLVDGSALLQVDKDAGFMAGTGNQLHTQNNARIIVNGNSNVYTEMDVMATNAAFFGATSANWLHVQTMSTYPSREPVGNAVKQYPADSTAWSGDTTLQQPDSLVALRATLNSNSSTAKKNPFNINTSMLNTFKIAYGTLRSTYNAVCPSTGGDAASFQDYRLECFYEHVPDSLKLNGFLVVDMQGVSYNNLPTIRFSHKYVFLNMDGSINGQFPGTTSEGRALVYVTGSGVNFGLYNNADCYCVVYNQGGGDVMSGGTYYGTVVTPVGVKLTQNGGTFPTNYVYDQSVLNDIAGTGSLIDATTGTPLGGTSSSSSVPSSSSSGGGSPGGLVLLTPRLFLTLMSEYPVTDLVDTAVLIKPGPGLSISPSTILVDSGAYSSLSDVISTYGVQMRVTFPQGTCSISQVGSDPDLNTIGAYNVGYSPGCGVANQHNGYLTIIVGSAPEIPTGTGVVKFQHARIVKGEDAGNVPLPVSLTVHGSLLNADTLEFTLADDSKNGEEYIFNSYQIIVPAGSESGVIDVPLQIIDDDIPDQTDSVVVTVTNANGGTLALSSPITMTINIEDNEFTPVYIYAQSSPTGAGGLDTSKMSPRPDSANLSLGRYWYRKGRQVSIEAVPSFGWQFKEWGSGSSCVGSEPYCTLTMDDNKAVYPIFELIPYTLFIPSVAGGFVVTDQPTLCSAVSGGTLCSLDYTQTVLLTAAGNSSPDYDFKSWSVTGGNFSSVTANPLSWSPATASGRVVDTATPKFSLHNRPCFYDDFSDAAFTPDWVQHGTVNFVQTGGYITGDNGSSSSWLIRDLDIGDNGTAETQVQFTNQYGFSDGVVLRYTDSAHYYMVGYKADWGTSPNHIYFCKPDGSCQWGGANLPNPTSAITFKVIAMADSFQVYLNGTLYATFHDASYSSGRVGMISGSDWSPQTTWYDFRWTDAEGCGTNDPPVITSCEIVNSSGTSKSTDSDTLTVSQNTNMTVKATVADPEDNAMTYHITATDGYSYPASVVTSGSISRTDPHSIVGSYALTLFVTDTLGAEASCTRLFKVVAPSTNHEPTISSYSAMVGGADFVDGSNAPQTVLFQIGAEDADGDPITYTWTGDAGSQTQTGSTSSLTYTFTAGGTYVVTITVTDGRGGTAVKSDTLVIVAPNSNPVIDSISPAAPSGTTPFTVALRGYAHDVNGDALTYTWKNGSTTIGTGASISFTQSSVGSTMLTLVVTDGKGGTTSKNVTVTANSVANQPPGSVTCFGSPSDTRISMTTGTASVALSGNASDPEGGPLTYTWGAPVNQTGQNITATFTSAWSGSVAMTVTDSSGASATCNVALAIKAANKNPTVTCAHTPTSGYTPLTVAFSATASDADGDPLTYSWAPGTGGSGNITSQSTSGFSYIFSSAGTFTQILTVQDTAGGIAQCTTSVSTTTNSAPTGGTCSVSPATVSQGQNVTGTASGWTDSDPTVQYAWSWDDGVTWTAYAATTSALKSWSADGSYPVKMKAKDGLGMETGVQSCGTVTVSTGPLTNCSLSRWLWKANGGIGSWSSTGWSYNGQDGNSNDGFSAPRWEFNGNLNGSNVAKLMLSTVQNGRNAALRYRFRRQDGSATPLKIVLVDAAGLKTDTLTDANMQSSTTWMSKTISLWSMASGFNPEQIKEVHFILTQTSNTYTRLYLDDIALECASVTPKTPTGICASPTSISGGSGYNDVDLSPYTSRCYEVTGTGPWVANAMQNKSSTAATIRFTWWGCTDQNQSNCAKQTIDLNQGNQNNNWQGIQSWDDNTLAGRYFVVVTNTSSLAGKYTFQTQSWTNGAKGCATTTDSVPQAPLFPPYASTCSVNPASASGTSGTTTVNVSWTDAISTEYSFNGGSTWQSSATSPTLATGSYSVKSRATNSIGTTTMDCGTFTVGSSGISLPANTPYDISADGSYTFSAANCWSGSKRLGLTCPSDGSCTMVVNGASYFPGWWAEVSQPASTFTVVVTGSPATIKCW